MDPTEPLHTGAVLGHSPANPEVRPLSLNALLRAESDTVPPAIRGGCEAELDGCPEI